MLHLRKGEESRSLGPVPSGEGLSKFSEVQPNDDPVGLPPAVTGGSRAGTGRMLLIRNLEA
jgi:hypothetical protein